MPATDARLDPFRGFNFRVEIDGLAPASFMEVSGLTMDRDSVDYREGTEPNIVRKLPGLSKITALVFKRGYVQDKTLWDWYQRIMDGTIDRRNGTVVLMNEAHQDVMAWTFVNAWPTKIEGPSFSATDNKVAVESMELQHEGLRIELLSETA
jgi:phage tail-like protein